MKSLEMMEMVMIHRDPGSPECTADARRTDRVSSETVPEQPNCVARTGGRRAQHRARLPASCYRRDNAGLAAHGDTDARKNVRFAATLNVCRAQRETPHHLTFSPSVISHSPRLSTLRQGSCVMRSRPRLVILVQPYRSMPTSCVRWSAISSRPLSVMRAHCPMLRVLSSCIWRTMRLMPSSLTWQEHSDRDLSRYSPCAMYARLWSPILSQKDTSRPERRSVPCVARCMAPVSLMLSQERRLRLHRDVMWDRWIMPASEIPPQKLRLSTRSLWSPLETCLSDRSVSFWQSCRVRCSRFRQPSAALRVMPARCPMPTSETCRHDLRLRLFQPAINSKPVLVMLLQPPSSSTSRFFRYWAIRPRLESVICLHRLRFSTRSDGISWTNACPRPLSLRLRRRDRICTRRMPLACRLGKRDGFGAAEVQLRLHPPPHGLVIGRVPPGDAHLGHPAFVPHVQAREEGRVGAAEVQLRLHPPPHGLVIGRVPPGDAHLGHPAFVPHVQLKIMAKISGKRHEIRTGVEAVVVAEVLVVVVEAVELVVEKRRMNRGVEQSIRPEAYPVQLASAAAALLPTPDPH
ncbi:LOW QUALITY PROTEIN: hypothetical protein CRUP_023667, partial [Coryphaenoides rupestris]